MSLVLEIAEKHFVVKFQAVRPGDTCIDGLECQNTTIGKCCLQNIDHFVQASLGGPVTPCGVRHLGQNWFS